MFGPIWSSLDNENIHKQKYKLVYPYPANIYLFKVNNRKLEKGVEYNQS